jgi:hypothetical protein
MHLAMKELAMADDIGAIARACYAAYVTKDCAAMETLIAADFHFTSPLDNRIDRAELPSHPKHRHLFRAMLVEQRPDRRLRVHPSHL